MPQWQPCFKHFQRFSGFAVVLVALLFTAAPPSIFAQTDEIQVYDAVIAPPGIFNIMVHSNFTPEGRTTPVFPGAIVANHSFNGAWEWAYGVKPWMEQGLYMPVYSPYSTNHGTAFDGFKIRELFVRPNAQQHKLFWGINFEFSFNQSYWEPRSHTAEMRPIMGAYVGKWELIYNPIVDTEWTGGPAGLEFNPSGRVVYNLNHTWDVAAEEYDGFGPFSDFASLHNQFHEAWGVFDRNGKVWNIEAGAGLGLTAGSDRWTLKLMISRDINAKPWRPHL
jgi:hypothetical protein